MKKRISLILVFAMLVSLIVPFTIPTASAASAITKQSELAAMGATGEYYLANDITISGSWNYTTVFTGTLDGKGHTIRFADSTAVTVGLIKAAGTWNANTTIKDLNIVYGNVTWTADRISGNGHYAWSKNIGGVVGSLYSNDGVLTIQNVTVTANITKSDDFNGFAIGGILGDIRQGKATITNCAFNGSINGTNTTSVSGFGGIVGNIYDGKSLTITKCVNNGSITGSVNVGGIFGNSYGAGGTAITISQCVNRGSITCSNNAYAGGIIGHIKQNANAVSIQNNINYGAVTDSVSGATPAGICGGIESGSTSSDTIKYNVNYGTITASSGTAAQILGTGTATQTSNYSSSTAADTIISNLNGTNSTTYVKNSAGKVLVVYPVTSAVQLAQMDGNGAYSLSNDLTLSGTWSYSKIFKGHFDGGNHTITFANGITITGGLFQELQAGAYVHDLKIVQAGSATWNYYTSGVGAAAGSIGAVAAFVGANGDTTEANLKAEANKVRIENVTATVSISKSTAVSGSNEAAAIGGIVGSLCTYTAITRCTVNGTIADSYDHNGTSVYSSNAERSAYGGIVGLSYRKSRLDVTECINNASVTGKGQQGGILGGSTTIDNGDVCTFTIQRCINNGTVTCNGTETTSSVGGIAGYLFSEYSNGTIKNNINNGSLAKASGSAYAAGIAARIRRGQNNRLYFLGNIQRSSTLAGGNNIIYQQDGSGTETNNHSYSYDFFAHVKGEVDAMITLNANYPNTFVFRNNKVTLKWTDSTSFNTITSFIGVQTSGIADAKRSIRILAGTTNNLTVNSVGVEVTVFYGSNGGNKTFYDSNTRVHGFIYAAGQKVTAASQGVSYIYTAKLNNVPTSLGTVTLLIRTYHKVGSQKYYSDYSAMTLNLAS